MSKWRKLCSFEENCNLFIVSASVSIILISFCMNVKHLSIYSYTYPHTHTPVNMIIWCWFIWKVLLFSSSMFKHSQSQFWMKRFFHSVYMCLCLFACVARYLFKSFANLLTARWLRETERETIVCFLLPFFGMIFFCEHLFSVCLIIFSQIFASKRSHFILSTLSTFLLVVLFPPTPTFIFIL